MERRIIDPFGWEEQYSIVGANEVVGPSRTLYCSGLADIDAAAHGRDDMQSQLLAVFDQLDDLLAEAGMALADVVRLNIYTVDPEGLFQIYGVLGERLKAGNAKVAGCLLGVARLALPHLLLEVEATACK